MEREKIHALQQGRSGTGKQQRVFIFITSYVIRY